MYLGKIFSNNDKMSSDKNYLLRYNNARTLHAHGEKDQKPY